jgi:hypothetical protein
MTFGNAPQSNGPLRLFGRAALAVAHDSGGRKAHAAVPWQRAHPLDSGARCLTPICGATSRRPSRDRLHTGVSPARSAARARSITAFTRSPVRLPHACAAATEPDVGWRPAILCSSGRAAAAAVINTSTLPSVNSSLLPNLRARQCRHSSWSCRSGSMAANSRFRRPAQFDRAGLAIEHTWMYPVPQYRDRHWCGE